MPTPRLHIISRGLLSGLVAATLMAFSPAEPEPKPEPPVDTLWYDMRELGPRDVELYRSIWELQEIGQWQAADKLIKQVENPILMGHIQYQRYMHPTAYRSSYKELSAWMKSYADHPNARDVYRLALRRQGRAKAPVEPVAERAKDEAPSVPIPEKARTSREEREVSAFRRQFFRDVGRTVLTKSGERLWDITERGLLSKHEIGGLGAHLARAWYDYGDDAKAFDVASRAAKLSAHERYIPFWVAGLAAWRQGDCRRAAEHFSEISKAADAPDDILAAGAFWAARSYLKCEKPEQSFAQLRQAALYDLSFYGLIAQRQLDLEKEKDWADHHLTAQDWDKIKADKAVRRVIALVQIGDTETADKELRSAWKRASSEDFWPLLKLATSLDLPESQVRIAESRPRGTPAPLAALYPSPSWLPADGFSMDRALLFALIRQESRFSASARSHAGARGLMQVMPRTASFIAGDRRLVRDRERRLYDPEFNMALGQRYLGYLVDHDVTYGNLFMVLAAYNGGPGNLSKWLRTVNYQDDPLLFMESIPNRETRGYVEVVMANYWVYRQRFGQATPSLDAVASGAWPPYDPQDALDQANTVDAVTALLD